MTSLHGFLEKFLNSDFPHYDLYSFLNVKLSVLTALLMQFGFSPAGDI
jgi:hypothetical protein